MADIKYKAEGKVSVNSRLNVRSGNGTNTSIIGKLTNGTVVNITHKTSDKKFNDKGTKRGGYKIEYKGSSAYVCDRYVKITKEYKEESSSNSTSSTPVTNNEADVYILTGTVKILPNLSIQPRDTVTMQGLGKNLSGVYFVEEVTINIDNKGISQDLSVSKNAFGGSINSPSPNKTTTASTTPTTPSKVVTPTKPNTRVHVLKKGETLWALAVKYYGSGLKWTHIAKANNIDPKDDKKIRSLQIGLKLTIPYL